MYYLLEVLIENKVYSLDKTFSYYHISDKPIFKWTRVLLNFNGSIKVGYVLKVSKIKKEDLNKTPYELKPIIKQIDEEPIINDELYDLALYLSNKYVAPLISCLQVILPANLKPKSSSLNKKTGIFYTFVEYLNDNMTLNDKEKEILSIIKEKKYVLKSKIRKSVLNSLLEKNCIRTIELDRSYLKYNNNLNQDFTLTAPQKSAYEKIINSENKNIILKGVISSGKTIIYLKLIDYILSKNKTVFYLVPEILFTDYLKNLFISRYGNEVVFITSSLTPEKKSKIFQDILSNNVKIVLGTKSAIFAPLKNIGLVIVDEEFSRFYLNEDSLPYYDAVDVAQYRAKKHDAIFLIGSATPSIKRYAMCKKGLFNLIELNESYFKNYSELKVVNLNNINNIYPGHSLFSKEFITKLAEVLKNNRQAMIIINKKGFSSLNYCQNCGTLLKCPKCDKPLIFYKPDKYICNSCGYKIKASGFTCKNCSSHKISNFGYGVDKIIEELHGIFKNNIIKKVDINNTKKDNEVIINEFKEQKVDILVGTELLSKGHNFETLDLVCLLNIDDLLNSRSYLADEKAFDLIIQSAGRSARNNQNIGYCIIQTYNPENNVIKLAALDDYELFYQYEMKLRKKLQNPPYYYVSSFHISSNNEENLANTINNLLKIMQNLKNFDENIIFYKRNIKKIGNTYVSDLILKYKKQEEILKCAKRIVKNKTKYSNSSDILFKPDIEYF